MKVDEIVSHVPPAWLTELRVVGEISSRQAIIAGGALRDVFLQRAPKDVDIFVRISVGDVPDFITRWMTFLGNTNRTVIEKFKSIRTIHSVGDNNFYDCMPGYLTNMTYYHAGTEYNVILFDPDGFNNQSALLFTTELISNFDLNANMVAYTVTGRLVTTPEFEVFAETKNVSVIHNMIRTSHRLDLLLDKYHHIPLTTDDVLTLPDYMLDDEIPF